jgi:hypothetical protein
LTIVLILILLEVFLPALLLERGSLSKASNVTGVPKTTLALQNRKPKTDLLKNTQNFKVLFASRSIP